MEWQIILCAVVTATALNHVIEPGNIRYKLRRLNKAIKSGEVETPPLKGIDTRPKAYGVSLAGFLVFAAITCFVANLIDPSAESAMIYACAVAFVGMCASVYQIDKYHIEIEKITQAQGKKK